MSKFILILVVTLSFFSSLMIYKTEKYWTAFILSTDFLQMTSFRRLVKKLHSA